MWRNRRGPNHRGGGGGGDQRASMSGADIGNVGAVNVGGKLLCDDEVERNDNSDSDVPLFHYNRGIYDSTFGATSIDTTEVNPAKQHQADTPNTTFDEIGRLFRRCIQGPSSP